MNQHLLMLIYAFGIFLAAVILFLPGKGLISRFKRSKKNNSRALVEDALKQIFNLEQNQKSISVITLSKKLSLSNNEVEKIFTKLIKNEMLESNSNKILLTQKGRSEAIRIIRSHRLWEKYLETKTGFSETDYHSSAEYHEHLLTVKEVDELAASLNNPIYDPHGDPIPQADGSVLVKKGISLTELEAGKFAHIIHIEDEPETIYAQLVAEGLYPDMQIQLVSKSKDRIRFIADGNECVLAPIFAENISVIPIKEENEIKLDFKNLTELKIGERAEVEVISAACRGQQRRRLLDLGIVPGTTIKAERSAALGDPVAYEIRGSLIALRKKHASLIYIK